MKHSMSFCLLAPIASQLCSDVESFKRKPRKTFFIVAPTEFGSSESVARRNALSQEITPPLSDNYKKNDLQRDYLELKPPQQLSTSSESTELLQRNNHHSPSNRGISLPLLCYGLSTKTRNGTPPSRFRRLLKPVTLPTLPTLTPEHSPLPLAAGD